MSLTIAEPNRDLGGYTPMHELHPAVLSMFLMVWFGGVRIYEDNVGFRAITRTLSGNPDLSFLSNTDADCSGPHNDGYAIKDSLAKADIHEMCADDYKEFFDA